VGLAKISYRVGLILFWSRSHPFWGDHCGWFFENFIHARTGPVCRIRKAYILQVYISSGLNFEAYFSAFKTLHDLTTQVKRSKPNVMPRKTKQEAKNGMLDTESRESPSAGEGKPGSSVQRYETGIHRTRGGRKKE
jgi:hypothetical protein